jgi:hypothetical protein
MDNQNNKPRETLSFKLGLSGTFWDRRPEYTILISGEKITSGTITGESNALEYIEFDHTIEEDSDYTLEIRLENKDDSDTKVDEHGQIVKDMLLNIESIEIDDINVENLIWSISKYTPDDKDLPTLTKCTSLGWNGTYYFPFSSPFYVWLLENL